MLKQNKKIKKDVVLSSILVCLMFIFALSCSTTQGNPVTTDELGYKTCKSDSDCINSYCREDANGSFCAFDCRTSNDCVIYGNEGWECNKSNHCVDPNVKVDGDVSEAGETNTTIDVACEYRSPDECADYHWPANCADRYCTSHGWQYTCDKDSQKCVDSGLNLGTIDDTKPAAAYTGIWGTLYTTAAITTGLPMIGEQKTVTAHWTLSRLKQDGDKLVMDSKVCKMVMYFFKGDLLETSEESLFGGMVITKPYWENVAMLHNVVENVEELKADSKYVTTEVKESRGCKLKDLDKDDLPNRDSLNAKDSRIWDQDKDGNPGMTTMMTGTFNGEVFSTQRWSGSFDGKVFDKDHIAGLFPNLNEQYQIDAIPASLNYETESLYYEKEPNRSFFRMIRMDNEATCEDVMKIGETENSWLWMTSYLEDISEPPKK